MTPSPQIRAGCYCRISSDPHDKREGTDRQRQDTTVLCEVKDWLIAGYYVDDDRSASNGKARPEWERLLSDIKAGKIDAIAAWDQDRGWRMMHELEELRRFFASLKRPIRLATTGQGEIDLNSPTGVMMAQVKTAVSEHEIAMMSRRMTRAALQKAERGVARWNQAFGYTKLPDGTIEIDPVTGPLMARAYEMFLMTKSIADVNKMLTASGHLSGRSVRPKLPDGKIDKTAPAAWTTSAWSTARVHKMLRSPRNAAFIAYKGGAEASTDRYGRLLDATGVAVPGNWPALVSEDLWLRVQAILDDPERRFPEQINPGRKYVLTALIRCGVCGVGMRGFTDYKDRAQRVQYRCWQKAHVTLGAKFIEPMIFGLVAGRLAAPDATDLLLMADYDAELAEQVRVRRAVLTARLGELADERADGILDGPGYKRMVDRIQGQIKGLDAQVQDTDRAVVLTDLPLGRPEVADALATLSMDRYRQIVALLMDITVDKAQRKGRKFGASFDPDRIRVTWK